MIINQTIKGGFSVVSKTGRYFQLISAGGIVKVRLMLQGSVVFESDMWVGMNLDKPIEFDSVEIKGGDGQIQFWAGEVSMQLLQFGNDAAKAIRTNTVLVNGKTEIVGSDLTRKAVRMRTDTDITIGGAAVSGFGWKQAAGTTQEYPVAGSLYAFKAPPKLDVLNATFTKVANDKYFKDVLINRFLISNDRQAMLAITGVSGSGWVPKIWTAESPVWTAIAGIDAGALFCSGMIKIPLNNSILLACFHGTNGTNSYNNGVYVKIYQSFDDGRTWAKIATHYAADFIDMSKVNNSSLKGYAELIGNIVTWRMSGMAVCFDLLTENVAMFAGGDMPNNNNSSGIFYFAATESSFKELFLVDKNYQLQKSMDGGNSWQLVTAHTVGDDRIFISPDKKDIGIIRQSDSKFLISNDYGANFFNTNKSINAGQDNNPIYAAAGLWLLFTGTKIESYQVEGVTVTVESSISSQPLTNPRGKPVLCNDGTLVVFSSDDDGTYSVAQEWSLTLSGTVAPAVVEIMELLA